MSKRNVITARVDDELLAALDRLGGFTERSRAWLVAEAVRNYVKEETSFFDFLQEGEKAIERGDFSTHEQLSARLVGFGKAKQAA